MTDLDPKDRDIAMVFQNYALYPHMTVAANMGFSLEHRGRPKAEIAERVRWAADILGLAQLLDRHPRQLSGGQRQRVAMGRAIVRDPQVFLFDEPLSNLDAKLRIVMRGEIKGLHQRLKTTTVYVTHDQVEAMTMADRIVVLNAGRVEQVGTAARTLRPSGQSVRGRLHRLARDELRARALHAQGLRGRRCAAAAARGRLRRPRGTGRRLRHPARAFRVLRSGPGRGGAGAGGGAPGLETQLGLRLGAAQVVALFHERLAIAPGDVLHLRPKTGAVHLFDPATGMRIDAA